MNTVGDKKEGEVVLTPTQTSKTALELSKAPAPTPEPSKTALPLSGTSDTGSSVVKIGLCVAAVVAFVAFIAVVAAYRCVSPEIFENIFIVSEVNVNGLEIDTHTSFEQLAAEGYKQCRYRSALAGTSYIWRFFIRRVKKKTRHWSYFDSETDKPIEGMPPSLKAVLDNGVAGLFYKPNPAT